MLTFVMYLQTRTLIFYTTAIWRKKIILKVRAQFRKVAKNSVKLSWYMYFSFVIRISWFKKNIFTIIFAILALERMRHRFWHPFLMHIFAMCLEKLRICKPISASLTNVVFHDLMSGHPFVRISLKITLIALNTFPMNRCQMAH